MTAFFGTDDLKVRLSCLSEWESTREHVANAIEALKSAYTRLEAIRLARVGLYEETEFGAPPSDDPTCKGCLTDAALRYATISEGKVSESLECVGRFLADLDSGLVVV